MKLFWTLQLGIGATSLAILAAHGCGGGAVGSGTDTSTIDTETATSTSSSSATMLPETTEGNDWTDCVESYADAGTSGDPCAMQWVCDSGKATYQIACWSMGSNYVCACSTNTGALQSTVTLAPFSCDLNGGALGAAHACGWEL